MRFDKLNGGRFDKLNANGVLGRARAPFALSLSKRTHGTVDRPIFNSLLRPVNTIEGLT